MPHVLDKQLELLLLTSVLVGQLVNMCRNHGRKNQHMLVFFWIGRLMVSRIPQCTVFESKLIMMGVCSAVNQSNLCVQQDHVSDD